MNAEQILAALGKKYSPEYGWIFVSELRTGTGYGNLNEQKIDAWAIRRWKTKKISSLILSFEVKVDRQDFLNEMKNPDKRWFAKSVSHEFYFVTPVGLIKPHEVSRDDGILEYNETGFRTLKPAHQRTLSAPRWAFVASLLATVKKINEKERK